MKDRQKIYLDKIVKILVTDTIIDYDKGRVQYPFFPFFIPSTPLSTSYFIMPSPSFGVPFFTKYCKERYGLTGNEIEYVWDQYKDITLGKLNNNER